jgi:peptidoglycan/xylan/chitin deacetylase (PgdA/CDA1 family)
MLKHAKAAVLNGLKATGGFAIAANSDWRQRRLLVLCYHGVSLRDEHEWNPELFVSPAHFERRMELLAEGGYNVLPLGEAVERMRQNSLPRKSVVITFDDGFADFYLRAYPILKKYGFPATVYLTTYYVFLNRPIFNLVVPYMLWRRRDTQASANAHLGWNDSPELGTVEGRRNAWQLVNAAARSHSLSGLQLDERAAEVAAHIGLDYGALRQERVLTLMTADECAEMARNGISIELHTHRHRTPEDPLLFTREVEENRAKIRDITGTTPEHFCYPSGVHGPYMLPLLEKARVRSATTCEPALATSMTNPLLIPRLLDTQILSEIVFTGWLAGPSTLLPSRR